MKWIAFCQTVMWSFGTLCSVFWSISLVTMVEVDWQLGAAVPHLCSPSLCLCLLCIFMGSPLCNVIRNVKEHNVPLGQHTDSDTFRPDYTYTQRKKKKNLNVHSQTHTKIVFIQDQGWNSNCKPTLIPTCKHSHTIGGLTKGFSII